MPSPTSRERLYAWLLVAVQLVLIAAVVFIPRRPAWDESAWLTTGSWGVIAAGILLGIWGAIHLGDGLTPLPLPNGAADLVTRGPYRLMRHPIYSAVILGTAGVALRSRTPLVLGAAALLAVFLAFKARWEERHLRATFEGYLNYESRVGRFVPGIGRNRRSNP